MDAPPPSQSQTNGALQASALNPSPLPQQLQQYSGVPAPSSPAPQSAQAPQFPPGVKVAVNEQSLLVPQQNVPTARPPSVAQQAPRAVPGSLSDLVVSFENAKQKGLFYHRSFQFSFSLLFSCTSHEQLGPSA